MTETKTYLITWQPEEAESGYYFLSLVQHTNASLPELMALAFKSEDLDPSQTYELCSIIETSDHRVIY
jgi:hypothetical protein